VHDENSETFAKLVTDHLDAAYNLARWILPVAEDAEDIVQESFIRAFNGYAAFHGGNPRSWILTIVRNAAYNHVRDRHSERWESISDELGEILSADELDAAEQMMMSDQKLAIAEALAILPAEYREAIVLREIEEMSYKEIARIQSIPIGTVMSRLARARQQLRVTLKRTINQ
jgi:RNA polymerase sigma factor (sigma-70 family)